MKSSRAVTLCVTAFTMVLLILDSRSAIQSAMEGIDICLRVVIPSLFPFFFLSAIINDRLLGINLKVLRPLTKICKIPAGSESLLILGLIGGYPVGAAGIQAAHHKGSLNRIQAIRMLSFCNNAGPAFLFGIIAPVFDSTLTVWALWFIHIASAILVAVFIPSLETDSVNVIHTPSISPQLAMQIAIRNTTCVCGWIVIFRMILGFCQRWFLWLLPKSVQILIMGILELSNGCLALSQIPCLGLRFLFAAIILSFGGLCVGMQTASVIGTLPLKNYWYGKVLQTAITFLLAGTSQRFLFPNDSAKIPLPLFILFFVVATVPFIKKAVAFSKKTSYNKENSG